MARTPRTKAPAKPAPATQTSDWTKKVHYIIAESELPGSEDHKAMLTATNGAVRTYRFDRNCTPQVKAKWLAWGQAQHLAAKAAGSEYRTFIGFKADVDICKAMNLFKPAEREANAPQGGYVPSF